MKYEKTLSLICSNEFVMEELKQLFLEEADKSRPKIAGQDDTVLGQEYRAHVKAKEIIEDTFMYLYSLNEQNGSGVATKYR